MSASKQQPTVDSPEGDGDVLLRARNLGFRRGERWIFRNLDLTLRRGEFLALVGPSGVGKTTLLSCFAGLLDPDEGTVEIFLEPGVATAPREIRHRLGIIFQSLALIPNADLLTNVQCGRIARFPFWRTVFGFPKNLRKDAYALLADLGVGADPYKWVSEMSGGEQQRVAIARTFFQEPAMFFADEPVSNLDNYYAGRVMGLLRQEADGARRRSVVCVLHDPQLIQRWADRSLSLGIDGSMGWRVREIRPTAPHIRAEGAS